MMIRISFLFFILYSFLVASVTEIENKIDQNKKKIENVLERKSNLDKNIETLAKRINKEESEYSQIADILETTNTQLLLNKVKLSSARSNVEKLQKKAKELAIEKEKTEQEVLDFVIEKYAMSMGIDQADRESLKDVIAKETYTLIFDNVKEEIMDINIQYLKINKSIRTNEKKVRKINQYIKKQNAIQRKYKNLVAAHKKKLGSLRGKHKQYQKHLQKLVNKQNEITDLLGSLNILKKEEIKKEEDRIRKEKELQRKKELAKKRAQERKKKLWKQNEQKKKQMASNAKKALKEQVNQSETDRAKPTKEIALDRKELDDDIDIEVRKIGSSAKGIKISKYNGRKTMAPLKSYSVTKKFGKYYDKVYKMELFNESVSLKTKIPNAKVFSIFKGQVVYAKQNSGLLENVVIVKHQNNLHTIYSHLDKIAPTLKVGKWIPKGYVVGRVSDTLEFQATKNSRYIDPLKLIK
jgi:murein DD-endopeptidase MepM/ murein hydrolase activator NlpD